MRAERNTFSIGMLIGLSSWTLIFVTLMWGYVTYRLRAESWLQGYITPQAYGLAVCNTVALIASSVALNYGFKQRPLQGWIFAAFILGVVFLAGQTLLWQMFLEQGLHWQSSQAGSFFFLLTGFHFLHIIVAVPALLILALRFKVMQGSMLGRGIKYFWDMLLAVWLIVFALVFIIK